MLEFYWIAQENVGRGIFSSDDMPEVDKLRIRQLVVIDAISRIQAAIESTLVLIDVLSRADTQIAETLTYYDARLPRQVVENIRAKKYDLEKILSLTKISQLGLEEKEELLLAKLYKDTVEVVYGGIARLADFYDKFRIVYVKSKHGLTLIPGASFGTSGDVPIFEDSLLFAFDHKKRKDMPKDTIDSKVSDPKVEMWYNAETIIRFGKNLEDEITSAISDLDTIVSYIVDNKMTYVQNCGETYIPVMKVQRNGIDGHSPYFFQKSELTIEEQSFLQSITNKVVTQMNMIEPSLHMYLSTNNPVIQKSLFETSVTNLWYGDKDQPISAKSLQR